MLTDYFFFLARPLEEGAFFLEELLEGRGSGEGLEAPAEEPPDHSLMAMTTTKPTAKMRTKAPMTSDMPTPRVKAP